MVAPSFLRLRDGRRLAYQDAPVASGVPMLFLHGLPSCRITRPDEKRITAAIPGAQWHFLPEESHLFFLSRWREILGDLLARG